MYLRLAHLGFGSLRSKSQSLGCTDKPRLFIMRLRSFVTRNINGCSPFARVLLLKQITEIVASIPISVYTLVYTPRAERRRKGVEHTGFEKCPKTRKPRQSSDYQGFSLVGVTRFELATTRPPEVKFIFSDKSN